MFNTDPIDINTKTHVWAVQHGNPTKPSGVVYIDCIAKISACCAAAELGHKRLFIAKPIAREKVPTGETIVKFSHKIPEIAPRKEVVVQKATANKTRCWL